LETAGDPSSAYLADLHRHEDADPVFNAELGLVRSNERHAQRSQRLTTAQAVEQLPEGVTIEGLWQGGLLSL
jgi:putative hemolysin